MEFFDKYGEKIFSYDFHDWVSHDGKSVCEMPSCTLETSHDHLWEEDERTVYQWSAKIYLSMKDSLGNKSQCIIEEGHGEYRSETDARKAAIYWYVFGRIEEPVKFVNGNA